MSRINIATFIFFLFHIMGLGALPLTKDTISPLISFTRYGENEGITSKTIYSIIQDTDGFIWVGTDAGAFRYDGKHFKRFTLDDGLSDNEILGIYQDRHGRIWFMTFNGHLSFYKEGIIYNSGNTLFLNKAYNGGSIHSVYEDKKGQLWFGTMKSGFIIINNDSVEKIDPSDKKKRLSSIFVHEDLSGAIWSFRKGDYMIKFNDPNTADSIILAAPISPFNACHNKEKAETYFCSPEGGVIKITDRVSTLYIDKSQLPSYSLIINIISIGDYLWICTRGDGCYEYQNGKFTKKYFENSVVSTVQRDREDNLWFGTFGEGSFMLPAKNNFISNFNQSTGLSYDKVTSVAYGKNGALWLGYSNGAVDMISGIQKKTYKITEPGDQILFRVTSLVADSNITWCGSDRGISFIQNDRVHYIPYDKKKNDLVPYSVKQIIKGSENKFYATYSYNLMEVAKDRDEYNLIECFDSITRTFSIVEYKKNDFIVSGMQGLTEYIPGIKLDAFHTDVDLSSMRIIDMKTDSNLLLVLATNGNGLYMFQDSKLVQHFQKSSGLSDNNCKRICFSGNYIYVATDGGLNILEKKNNQWSVSDIVTTRNNLLSNMVNDVAVSDQNIYVATDKGLSVLSRTIITPEIFTGKVIVTEVITDSVKNSFQNQFHFSSDIPRLLIRFAYPVFNSTNSANVKYRLVQNKDDAAGWVVSTSNEVEFSSLNPGDYIFQLKHDKDETNMTNLYFSITPMWWQTISAKVFFGGAFASLLVFIVRRRTKKKYEDELKQLALLEAERSRIASDMHDDIGADLTQIRLWSYIQKNAKDKSGEMMERIAATSDEVLQKMEQIIWALDSKHDNSDDLVSFLCEYAMQYLEATDIKISCDVDDNVPDFKLSAIQRRNIFLVIKELLHNTVKHSEASEARLKIVFDKPDTAKKTIKLNMIYSDNGKGYDPAMDADGLGHVTIQKRMEEISSSINIRSKRGEGFTAHLMIDLKS